ncbi:MAG TPA: type II toxin-antitoxin system VapC family toxin [Acidimicrobiales bacterium]|nr:type II toxin-antitoxin system VapC family toxin [Acidimicrobiales bacterium]
MTLAVDASALVKRYLHEPGRDLVLEAMADDRLWCASELCRAEAMLVLHRVASGPRQARDLWRSFRDDWDAFNVVPVDDRCLARATEIGVEFGLRTVDAVHLAAADRLPRPVSYLTFDRHQIPGALALGLQVVSPLASEP